MTFGLGNKFAGLLRQSFSRDVEVTLEQLLELMEMPSEVGLFAKIAAAKDQLEKFGLELQPNLDSGDLSTPRVLRQQEADRATEASIRSEIARGEAADREFKASLSYDHRRATNDPNVKPEQLDSDAVCLAALKTICAFLNDGGGVLLVGVQDDGSCVGIEPEFQFLKQPTCDHWELRFRDLIRARFHDGNLVCSLIRCEFVQLDGKTVARIRVSPRSSKLCFARENSNSDFRLFVRQGNRTAELKVFEVEDFLKTRPT